MKLTSVSRMKKFPFAHKQLLQWSSRASSSLRSRLFNSSLYLSRAFPASSSTPPRVLSYQSLNFSSAVQSLRCSASMEEMQAELSRREKAANIMPYLDIDFFMKVLGFEVYIVTMVGDQMLMGYLSLRGTKKVSYSRNAVILKSVTQVNKLRELGMHLFLRK